MLLRLAVHVYVRPLIEKADKPVEKADKPVDLLRINKPRVVGLGDVLAAF